MKILLKELANSKDVLIRLVWQQMILRYRRTKLGYLWTLVNPLLMMSVMAIVFSNLFKSDLKTFAIFLFAGMVPWNFFSAVVSQTGGAFLNNEGLIKKIYLPKALFPLSIIISLAIDSMLSFFALFAIMGVVGAKFGIGLIFLPFSYILLIIFATGVGFLISVASVYFRDLQYIMAVVMQGLFFLTPVLYRHDSVGGHLELLVTLNPVTPYIELFRNPLFMGTFPSVVVILKAAIISIAFFLLGLVVFMRKQKQIVFRL